VFDTIWTELIALRDRLGQGKEIATGLQDLSSFVAGFAFHDAPVPPVPVEEERWTCRFCGELRDDSARWVCVRKQGPKGAAGPPPLGECAPAEGGCDYFARLAEGLTPGEAWKAGHRQGFEDAQADINQPDPVEDGERVQRELCRVVRMKSGEFTLMIPGDGEWASADRPRDLISYVALLLGEHDYQPPVADQDELREQIDRKAVLDALWNVLAEYREGDNLVDLQHRLFWAVLTVLPQSASGLASDAGSVKETPERLTDDCVCGDCGVMRVPGHTCGTAGHVPEPEGTYRPEPGSRQAWGIVPSVGLRDRIAEVMYDWRYPNLPRESNWSSKHWPEFLKAADRVLSVLHEAGEQGVTQAGR
jgi:hypothetical protein